MYSIYDSFGLNTTKSHELLVEFYNEFIISYLIGGSYREKLPLMVFIKKNNRIFN